MTPAIDLAKKLKLDYQLHTYEHESSAASYGLEVAEKLGVAVERVFKTLVIANENNGLAVAILPVSATLNFKKAAKALGCKKIKMADPQAVSRSTGYVLGGVSPLGQKKRLPTLLDILAIEQSSIYVSGGKRGLEIELPPTQLATALAAQVCDIVD